MRFFACLLLVGCAGQEPEWIRMLPEEGLGAFEPTAFGGEGEVALRHGTLELELGSPLTGVTWTDPFPGLDYEVRLDAARLLGDDFFCGLTFPVGEDHLTLVLGGWGGSLVGLSSLDGEDASQNQTRSFHRFETDRFYRVRLRVTAERVSAWVDDELVADVDPRQHTMSLRPEVLLCRPLGICSYSTRAAVRNVEYRMLSE